MSDVATIQATLSRAAEEAGAAMSKLLSVHRTLEEIRGQVGMCAEGSQNDTLQEALTGIALADSLIEEQVGQVGRSADLLIQYYHQL